MPPYERQAEPSKGNFLSWDAGESKDLVVLSEYGSETGLHWIDGESVACQGPDCADCAEGVKRSIRWTVQTRCEGEEIPWEMSNEVFFGVEDVAEMVGGLKDLRLRVTRHGTGLKTRYSVLPITAQEQAAETEENPAWYAEKVKRLCKLADLNVKQELKLFLTEIEPGLVNAAPLVQMKAFFYYIDKETKEFQKSDEPPPDEPQDIGRYF